MKRYIKARIDQNGYSYEIEDALNENPQVRWGFALSSHDPELLELLIYDSRLSVRIAVANNVYSSPDTLTELSKDSSPKVREAVARNDNTPPDTLMRLGNDDDDLGVMAAIAANPNTPEDLKQRLYAKLYGE